MERAVREDDDWAAIAGAYATRTVRGENLWVWQVSGICHSP